MFPHGLCEWKILNVHPIPAAVFKNVLRIFVADILTIFQNIQSGVGKSRENEARAKQVVSKLGRLQC